jgi:transposase InsO family protein
MIAMKVNAGKGRLCGLFGLTRQGWYDHRWRDAAELIDEGRVLEIVNAKHNAHRGLRKCSGKVMYEIIKGELIYNQVKMGRDKVLDVFRKYGLMKKRRRFRARTTFSDVNLPLFPNLVENMTLTRPEQLWVSDITYLRVGENFNYLSLITDAYSHRIMGYYLSETLETKGCMIALGMALANRTLPSGALVHHSDRGFQYRSQEYIKALRENGITSSMTQSGDPRENAIAERANGLLKIDMGLADVIYACRQDALEAVEAIIRTYNEIRPHSSVDMLTPVLAHQQTGTLKNRWKKMEVINENGHA